MTRGAYNENLEKWLQDLSAVNGATIDFSTPQLYMAGPIYKLSYQSENIVLEERRGSMEEIATLLSGDVEIVGDLAEKAGYNLDKDRHTRPVITR